MQFANDNNLLTIMPQTPPKGFRKQLHVDIGVLMMPLLQGKLGTMLDELNKRVQERGGIETVRPQLRAIQTLETTGTARPHESLAQATEIFGNADDAQKYMILSAMRDAAYTMATSIAIKLAPKTLIATEGFFETLAAYPPKGSNPETELRNMLQNEGGLGEKQIDVFMRRFRQGVRGLRCPEGRDRSGCRL